MVTMPASSKSSLRSLPRTSAVSMPRSSSSSSVSASSAPRGTAMVRPYGFTCRAPRPEGDVQRVEADPEADGGQRAAEAPQQLVVAPAAAHRLAERRVVDLEHRARVVAQAPDEAEV